MTLRQVLPPLVFWALAGVLTACWSTDGPGVGPYSQCDAPSQCAERDFFICLQREVGEGESVTLEALFCSIECPAEGPSGCPLGDVYAELKPKCISATEPEKTTYCGLVTENGVCPEGMWSVDIKGDRVCIFSDD